MPAGEAHARHGEIRNRIAPDEGGRTSAYEDRASKVEMLRAGAVGYLVIKANPRAADIDKMVRNAYVAMSFPRLK